jgi:L-lactate dehydrogenase complex protein LldG
LRIYTWVATSKTRFRLAIHAGALLARLFSPVRRWMRLPAFTGWGYSKDFPKPDFKPFRIRWAEIKADNQPSKPEIGEQEPSGLPDSDSARPYGQDLQNSDTHSLVNQFTSEIQALGGRVILCSQVNLPHQIIEYLKTHRIQEIQSWAHAYLPGGLIDELRKEQIKILYEANPEVSAGLTGAHAAIAETGSIVLAGGEGRALSASLLPEIHMAVLHARQIYSNLEQVFSDSGLGDKGEKSAAEILTAASAAAVISGPSRTADIEMTLTIGVHGPKEVVVFCIVD